DAPGDAQAESGDGARFHVEQGRRGRLEGGAVPARRRHGGLAPVFHRAGPGALRGPDHDRSPLRDEGRAERLPPRSGFCAPAGGRGVPAVSLPGDGDGVFGGGLGNRGRGGSGQGGGDRHASGSGQVHFTFAAIAAPQALFAEMVVAGVLGATDANSGGFLSTDAASERHEPYFFLPEVLGGGGGAMRVARQRWASRSMTSNWCSRSAAR